jgi:hypothetical protein
MKTFSKVALLATTTMFLAACEGDDGLDGIDGADGTNGLNTVVALRDLPIGDAKCIGEPGQNFYPGVSKQGQRHR